MMAWQIATLRQALPWLCQIVPAALLMLAAVAAPASAVTIELNDVAPDRIERQRANALGNLPLPGTPNLIQLEKRLLEAGVKSGNQVFVRLFKSESELELWVRKGAEFTLFATYPICHWAGALGPKQREGDKQNPEGFYQVGQHQMYHLGRWPRSLDLGYPNAFDKAQGRTGSYILVHGGCSSVGCFAMTNAVMEEIYGLINKAVRSGQRLVDVHVFPFRMTAENLASHAKSEWGPFWANLKEGYDAFERTHLPPKVGVCDRRYLIDDVTPGGGVASGPLAVCGGTLAAIETWDLVQRLAAGNSRSWTQWRNQSAQSQLLAARLLAQSDPSLALRLSQLGMLPPSPQSLLQSPATGPLVSLSPGVPPATTLSNPIPPLAASALPTCNLSLPSCRKFIQTSTQVALKSRRKVAGAAAARAHRVVR